MIGEAAAFWSCCAVCLWRQALWRAQVLWFIYVHARDDYYADEPRARGVQDRTFLSIQTNQINDSL